MTELRTAGVPNVIDELFQRRFRQYVDDHPDRTIEVLDAGCGRGGLPVEGVSQRGRAALHVVGIDVDEEPYRRHAEERADLDSWALGDLRTAPLPPRTFDLVHSSHLLERIEHAELVLDRLVAAVRPGGLLLLRMYDRDCVFGILDRTLPTVLRRGLRPGEVHPPRAVYEAVASREGVHGYCVMRGLVVAEERSARATVPTRRLELASWLVARTRRGARAVGHDEIAFVLRKPEHHFARVL
ncbi:MAG: methyltransferase domain-containing protein [Streptosporangiales bacterium]|nr:methyltransferase domain-containing protein [Streptosporangiales bacterium]